MTDEALPQADCIPGARHPRETTTLFGQEAAEATFLDAFAKGRLHHGWLITGPRGVGKATLAWRIARFLLADEGQSDAGLFGETQIAPASLNTAPDHPIARRVAAGAEPRLFHLRRNWDPDRKKLKAQIGVDDVRKMKSFFTLSSADGGRRVVLVDSVDEMNVSAANALLKSLEEPPENAVLLLVSHQPAGLLATIRSRCRELRCATLQPADMSAALSGAGIDVDGDTAALSELAGGSAGAAIGLLQEDGLSLYSDIIKLLDTCPQMDRQKALALAEKAGARGKEARLALTIRLIDIALSRLARCGAGASPPQAAAPMEPDVLARLAPSADAGRVWAALHQEIGARMGHGLAVNLDAAGLILDSLLKINQTAARVLSRA